MDISSISKINQVSYKKGPLGFKGSIKLERVPVADVVEFTKVDVLSKLRKLFDNETFSFKKYDGSKFKGTIKEYIEQSIVNKGDTKRIRGILHNTYKEPAIDILRNGLDWTKTSRMHFGPGTYFAMTQNLDYGKLAIEADYIGKKKTYPIFSERYYEAIEDNSAISKILKANKLNSDDLNKYCHEILTKDLGIDILYGGGRAGGCFVVLDDKCVKCKPYNFKLTKGDDIKYC